MVSIVVLGVGQFAVLVTARAHGVPAENTEDGLRFAFAQAERTRLRRQTIPRLGLPTYVAARRKRASPCAAALRTIASVSRASTSV